MKIKSVETLLANAGIRNYCFLRLSTDTGLTGAGEVSLEWQEQTVRTLVHEWLEPRLIGKDPFDIEAVVGGLIRDQYQGGATVMTAISGAEIAMWDLIGKACGQPVFKLLGGRAHSALRAYANGWYGGAGKPEQFAALASEVAAQGFGALKFDPFTVAWKWPEAAEVDEAVERVRAVRTAVGGKVEIVVEIHGRLAFDAALDFAQRVAPFRPAFLEEPIVPWSLEALARFKSLSPCPIAAGERAYMLEDFFQITERRSVDLLQPDIAHCGGLSQTKKAAAMAQARDIRVSPHVSVGPVALCAALHFDWSTPNVWLQEDFSRHDVPWRSDLVGGWNPLRGGQFVLPDKPGLGIEIDDAACGAHPYKAHAFPSLWDARWVDKFTQNETTFPGT